MIDLPGRLGLFVVAAARPPLQTAAPRVACARHFSARGRFSLFSPFFGAGGATGAAGRCKGDQKEAAMTPETTNYLFPVYIIYAATSIALTCWLARTLSKNGEVFLEEVFSHNPRLAAAVNHLLVVGFYMLNIGYAFMRLKHDYLSRDVSTPAEAVEALAAKLGSLLLVLGVLHMVNVYVFYRIRRRGQIRLAPPPVKPQMLHNGAAATEARF